MNVFSICLTITAFAGIVTGQGNYSLIPKIDPVPSNTFAEDISDALQQARNDQTIKSMLTLSDFIDSNIGKNIRNESKTNKQARLLRALQKLNNPIAREQSSSSDTTNRSTSDRKVSERSIIMEMNESEKVPLVHHIQEIPAAHQRLVRRVRPVEAETDDQQSGLVPRALSIL